MYTRKEELKTFSDELNINKLKKRGIFMVPINMKLSVLEIFKLSVQSSHFLMLISFWKTWEYQTTWPASCEICMLVKKRQLELDMEQQTGSQ